jgi:uncharacterized protein involved in response to NO
MSIEFKMAPRFNLFAVGFRPFFLLASLYGLLAVALWMQVYVAGHVLLPLWGDSAVWHGHEMIFGYTAAVIAGFLLTAVPNWTKARPVCSWRLGLLAGLWLAGRGGMLMAGAYPLMAMLVDMLFMPVLAAVLLPAVVKTEKWRNVVFFVLILGLALCNLAIHIDMLRGLPVFDARHALYVAVHLVVLMIAVFAGRIVPLFTHNALKLEGVVVAMTPPGWLEVTAVGLIALLALGGCVLGFDSRVAGALALAAAGANLARLCYWHGHRTLHMPIVWVLHAGYLGMIAGLGLEGLSAFRSEVPFSLALHGLTLGSIGMMTLAMMTRVSLGHSGRRLQVSRPIAAAYVSLMAAALVRVAGGLLLPQFYVVTVIVAGVLWMLAFALFTIVYLPILVSPRADRQPG